jgi:hypothetical protein
MARLHAGARFGGGAGKARRAARIDHLFGLRLNIGQHLRLGT